MKRIIALCLLVASAALIFWVWPKASLSQVVCDGNSLTLGYGVDQTDSYPSQLAALTPRCKVVNKGKSAQTTGDMIADFDADVAPEFDPSLGLNVYVATEGINAIYFGGSAQQAYEEIVTLCLLAKRRGFTVIVGTGTPRRDFPGTSSLPDPKQDAYDARVSAFNAQVRDNWPAFAHGLADFAADRRLQDPRDATYYSVDGVHLTAAGYGVMAEIVLTAIKRVNR